jgi:hypothetical protein
VLHVQPLNRRLSRTCFRYFIQLAVLSQGIKVYSAFGLPKLSLAAIKE